MRPAPTSISTTRTSTRRTASAGVALVEDLSEPGGTFVNHDELRGPTRMSPGDLLQIGVLVLKLRGGADAPAAVRHGQLPCWTAVSPDGWFLYTAKAGNGTISAFSLTDPERPKHM